MIMRDGGSGDSVVRRYVHVEEGGFIQEGVAGEGRVGAMMGVDCCRNSIFVVPFCLIAMRW